MCSVHHLKTPEVLSLIAMSTSLACDAAAGDSESRFCIDYLNQLQFLLKKRTENPQKIKPMISRSL